MQATRLLAMAAIYLQRSVEVRPRTLTPFEAIQAEFELTAVFKTTKR